MVTKTEGAKHLNEYPDRPGLWRFKVQGVLMELQVFQPQRGPLLVACEDLDYCGINSQHDELVRYCMAQGHVEASSLKNITSITDWEFVE